MFKALSNMSKIVCARFAVKRARALFASLFCVGLTFLAAPPALKAQSSAPITIQDLITLQNLGGDDSGVSISPNAQYVVFEVHHAMPLRNAYTNQWKLMNLRRRSVRTIIANGGEQLLGDGEFGNDQSGVGGNDDYYDNFGVLTPVWTPDNSAFYYVRKDKGRIRLHRMTLAGVDRLIATPPGQVAALNPLSPKYATFDVYGPTRATLSHDMHVRRKGLLVGAGGISLNWGIPDIAHSADTTTYRIDLGNAKITPFAPVQQPQGTAGLPIVHTSGTQGPVLVWSDIMRSPDGSKIAWFGITDRGIAAFTGDAARGTVGSVHISPEFHERTYSLTWSPDNRHVYFVAPDDYTASNIWVGDVELHSSHPVTHSGLFYNNCTFAADASQPTAACAVETTVRPKEVATIDLRTGRTDVLTNLNPHYNSLEKPRIEKMHWRNRYGDRAFGVLAYPRNYQAGKRFPLVITSYHDPAFERGSNGDEFPIPVLAADGFFVLDLSMEPYSTKYLAPSTFSQSPQTRRHDMVMTYESMKAAAEKAVDMLAQRGMIDPSLVGVCGLSGGSTFTSFAISHSHYFRAAIIEWSENDPLPLELDSGWERQDFARMQLGPHDATQWQQFSTAMNANRINTAVLMNVRDHELYWAIQTYWALHDHHKPVEMWVFANEFHTLWQPVHRLVVYERNVDWFKFWLQDRLSNDPAQNARWQNLKTLLNR